MINIYSWRVSKYNPKHRNEFGHYLKNDWTSFSDIGKVFNGEKLTYYDYFRVESNYVKVVASFMEFLKLKKLKVLNLERNNVIHNEENINLYEYERHNTFLNEPKVDYSFAIHPVYYKVYKDLPNIVSEGMELNIMSAQVATSLILRDLFWCKLVSGNKLQIHFGFDFYMYIVSENKCFPLINRLRAHSKLFIEEFPSPFLEQ